MAVLSYSMWANKFGSSTSLMGSSITLNATPYIVIGVAPRGFKGTLSFGSADQIWIPTSMYPQALAGFEKGQFQRPAIPDWRNGRAIEAGRENRASGSVAANDCFAAGEGISRKTMPGEAWR